MTKEGHRLRAPIKEERFHCHSARKGRRGKKIEKKSPKEKKILFFYNRQFTFYRIAGCDGVILYLMQGDMLTQMKKKWGQPGLKYHPRDYNISTNTSEDKIQGDYHKQNRKKNIQSV